MALTKHGSYVVVFVSLSLWIEIFSINEVQIEDGEIAGPVSIEKAQGKVISKVDKAKAYDDKAKASKPVSPAVKPKESRKDPVGAPG
ncbi:hypothetical protein FRX31_013816, partial [Thalictrum thalictroides]